MRSEICPHLIWHPANLKIRIRIQASSLRPRGEKFDTRMVGERLFGLGFQAEGWRVLQMRQWHNPRTNVWKNIGG
jgi:hypothetical protein